MAPSSTPFLEPRRRLNEILERAAPLERDGFPFGTLFLRNAFEEEARSGSVESAEAVVRRAAGVLALADRTWGPLRRLLAEFDALRDLAEVAGMDLRRVDTRAGNPRAVLLRAPISEASLDAATRSARIGLATLREALPPYLVEQAQSLGRWARDHGARGEDVGEVVAEVGRVVRALHDLDLRSAAGAVGSARRAIALRAGPTRVPTLPGSEEEAILLEAHNLARRLPGRELQDRLTPPDPPSSATEVEAGVLSPEEEVDALWAEVDRLVRERELAATGPLLAVAGPSLIVSPPVEIPAIAEEASASDRLPSLARPAAAGPAEELSVPSAQLPAALAGDLSHLPSAAEPSEPETPAEATGRWLPAGALLDAPTPAEAGVPPPEGMPSDAQRPHLVPPEDQDLATVRPQSGPPGGSATTTAFPLSRREAAAPGEPKPAREYRGASQGRRWMSRISISAAYVPPELETAGHRAPRPQRPPPRRARSRHRR